MFTLNKAILKKVIKIIKGHKNKIEYCKVHSLRSKNHSLKLAIPVDETQITARLLILSYRTRCT